jgi:acyl-CoA synthetase (AMP-forming)/AMP-acid ligase II
LNGDPARQGRAVMSRHWLIERLQSWEDRPALIWSHESWSFTQLCDGCDAWLSRLAQRGIKPGDTLAICGDYSPKLCAMLLAALLNRNIIIPLASATSPRWNRLMGLAQVQFAVRFDSDDSWHVTSLDREVSHPLLRQLKERDAPGLVLFSSGSTGESKASVLDFDRLLAKFEVPRPAYRTLVFLLLDHIGGINTLLHGLCHGGTIVTIRERSPDAVCAAIEAHRIQLLPTTPTFLRILLIADAIRHHDLSSLEIVTYGTEPMPPSTLAAVREALPRVRFKQTYGLSELGILPTQSRDSGSVWLKLGNTDYEHKIVEGVLWIRSPTAMLGYLNAPSPFDADGWFNTQDLVERDGEYIRILGRKSELINVGGEKVHPTEIENVVLQVDNVKDVTVRGQSNPVTGEVVAAKITPLVPEDPNALKRRVRQFCQARLERYKIPAVIDVVVEDHYGARFKKSRNPTSIRRPAATDAGS